MTDSTQRLIRDLFDAASELPPAERKAWLEARTRGNPEVLSSVLRLLHASSASSQGFMAEPLVKRAQPALQEGMNIGPYRVMRELGSGGMGVVYLAIRSDEVYRRLAAVKVIRPELKSNPIRSRFLQEREILGRLDHPNIARIIDGGETADGLPYFVMDYVDGQPLDQFCRETGANLQQRLNLFRQTCLAVQYLHDNNVLHRDLKPGNILVTHNGQVKLLDFGVSKLEDAFASTMTTGLPILTPGYASPEQLASRPVTRASDVYALGVVLYELLTGVRPLKFDGLGLQQILNTVATQTPARPSMLQPLPDEADPGRIISALRPQLAGDLDAIVLMALRKEPERRYASAAAFAADIERFQQRRPVIARGEGRMYVLMRSARRHRMKLVAAVLIVLSMSGAGVASYIAYREHQRAAAFEQKLEQAARDAEHAKTLPASEAQALVHSSVDRFSADYAANVPRLVESRMAPRAETAKLVADSLSYLNSVQSVAGDDPQTMAALGRAYLAVARTQWSPTHRSLNQAESAASTCLAAVNSLTANEKLRNDDGVKKALSAIEKELEHNPAAHQGLQGVQ